MAAELLQSCELNPIAQKLKTNDADDNMNPGRITNLIENDFASLRKYELTLQLLGNAI